MKFSNPSLMLVATLKKIARVVHPVLLILFASTLAMIGMPAVAADDTEPTSVSGSSFDIVTTALGLNRFRDYTANQNALGYGYKHRIGVEAAYEQLGESRFAGATHGDGPSEDVGGRIDLRVAFDVSAPVTANTRIFSRMGVYYWDIDVNFNRTSNDFNSAQAGNGQVMSIGAAYDERTLRFSLELEQVDRNAVIPTRDSSRVLMNISSRF